MDRNEITATCYARNYPSLSITVLPIVWCFWLLMFTSHSGCSVLFLPAYIKNDINLSLMLAKEMVSWELRESRQFPMRMLRALNWIKWVGRMSECDDKKVCVCIYFLLFKFHPPYFRSFLYTFSSIKRNLSCAFGPCE